MIPTRPATTLLTAGLWLVACGDPSDDDADAASTSGGIEAPTSDDSTSAGEASSDGPSADSSSSGAAPDGDPSYPRPDPVDEAGDCPDGFLGPITFDGAGWLCIPACSGDPPMCPAGASGDAEATCSTNPMSSAAPCDDSTDCEIDGEMCGNIGGGQRGCLLPPSHCILRCDDGQSCPDGLTCAEGVGVCQYVG